MQLFCQLMIAFQLVWSCLKSLSDDFQQKDSHTRTAHIFITMAVASFAVAVAYGAGVFSEIIALLRG